MLKKIKNWYWNQHIRHWVGIITLMALSVGTMNLQYNAGWLMGSVLDADSSHAPFDGTVPPIQVSPKWSSMSGDEYDYTYQELSMDKYEAMPAYDESVLTFPTDDLVWGNAEHNVIRNSKITYPVCWSGNYELDDTCSNAGSHPAVDIKALQYTPVHAIANGRVTESGYSSSWGYHIVIRHDGAPDPDRPGQTTTLYSSYSHLDNPFVVEGQEVSKGEVIAPVSNTGTATTYHLHFQIDKADSPWHPYWPFSTSEASAAGYNFWSAVSAGVGKSNVYAYTVDPFPWIYEHMSGYEAPEYVEPVVEVDEVIEEEVIIEEELVEEAPVVFEPVAKPYVDFYDVKIEGADFLEIGASRILEVKLLNSAGDALSSTSFEGDLKISVSDESVGRVSESFLRQNDFKNGSAEITVYAERAGSMIVSFSIADEIYSSNEISVIDGITPFAKFGVVTDGSFQLGRAESIQIRAEDLSGIPTPSFTGSKTLEISLIEGSGSLTPTTLTKKDFSMGTAEVFFTADTEDSARIQVVYGSQKTQSDALESRLFEDFDSSHQFFNSVNYLFKKGTVTGYPDGTFRPSTVVSRVESLKLIYEGMDRVVSSGGDYSFNDTQSGQWYSDYLGSAVRDSVVEGYADGRFKPEQDVTDVELLKMLIEAMNIEVKAPSSNPYPDVDKDAWYAPYVAFAKEKNLYPVEDGLFHPGEGMDRVLVTEVIYRLIAVVQHGGNLGYSDDLSVN
jgi:hypothetical protein